MLEEACDDCNVPLMRNRDGEVICFSCNAHFIKNQDGLYNVWSVEFHHHLEGSPTGPEAFSGDNANTSHKFLSFD